MLTLFATPTPFRGRAGVLQRDAIQSWTPLGRDSYVGRFGDEKGTSEVAWGPAARGSARER
jgi:hypothetical protein